MTRTEIRDNYDILHPNYTIFHEDDHTFTDVWTEYTEDFKIFYNRERNPDVVPDHHLRQIHRT